MIISNIYLPHTVKIEEMDTDLLLLVKSGSKREVNKRLRQSGQAYTDVKGRTVPERTFNFVKCKCVYSCSDVQSSERREFFTRYWNLQDWTAQSAFLRANVKTVSGLYVFRRKCLCYILALLTQLSEIFRCPISVVFASY